MKAPPSPPGPSTTGGKSGDDEAQALVEVNPGRRFIEIVGTLFGLARDGKVSPEGMPGPLQLATMGHEYRDVVVFTEPPPLVQRIVSPPLAALGRLRGYKPFYPEYIEPTERAEPDPAALAELTEDGRLRPFD